MIQQLLIATLFLAAVIYLGRIVYRSFRVKSECDSGCGKCGAMDLHKIEKELNSKGL